ncbi:DUF1656 domain-containing protein [Granulibacter bethesdensis]|uniref:Membrane associated protein n=2 Tax=Granulibacter bethesdensis TaxID=364410 RepID=Q0BQ72_GRABC|nr:DUF1656 domain-containing protein [Granulibacter bethesdensis]ABI63030.1 putative membrane associated protein [Granulibacter bethesdensis CGDNIH1]AHJ64028.1 putative membrane associated protein [Granulibacter bethesdensis]AHJ65388.1 putative membrane associated protein [Granulibacter bethesdensis CGDNIH4]AHJ68007.1 putative membrane associated protein [Granulibacter bethesdensis]APH52902.1 putative membrane associated protein [Granulibacter bethesdensis]
MIHEVNIWGVLVAPISVYGVMALVLFAILRSFWRLTGLLQFIWHPPLFELAVYVSILSLLVLYA